MSHVNISSISTGGRSPTDTHGERRSLSKWATRFLQLAQLVASWSKDPATQVGAVATNSTNHILETGYNGPPRGVEDLEARFQRPAKYLWTTHAEANLVAAAAASRLQGSTVYVTHLCCAQCAALLINSKVARVVCGPGLTSMAPEQFEVALRMFEEAGVELVLAEPETGGEAPGRSMIPRHG